MDRKHSKVIVTGQQIGLLGGPLYTTYKVLGAVKESEKVKGKAVYWLETNDADFSEINRIEYIDAQGHLQSLKWEKKTQGISVGYLQVDEQLVKLVNHFFSTLKQTEFTAELKRMAVESYQRGRCLAEASIELARRLFSLFHIELFNPQHRNFRRSTRHLLLQEAHRTPVDTQCNLFCIKNKRRIAVFKSESGFQDRDGYPLQLEKYDLVPNVKTRNVCQDFYFNTYAYIAGPGEVKYIKGLDEVYDYHQVEKAKIIPRMSLTLIEPKVKRLLKKLGVNLSDVQKQSREEFVRYVKIKFSGFNDKEVWAKSRQLIENFVRDVENLNIEVKGLQPLILLSLKKAVGTKRASEKQKVRDFLHYAAALYDYVLPFGKKQERIFNVFYYMNLYQGKRFVSRLYREYKQGLEVLEI